jgi:O-antigen/teichoic acid export membrane protein
MLSYVGFGSGLPGRRSFVGVACVLVLLGQVAVEVGSVRFQLEESFGRLAAWQASTQIGRFGVVIFLIAVGGGGLDGILAGYAAVGACTVGLGLAVMSGLRGGGASLAGHNGPPSRERAAADLARPTLAATARRAMPFALVTMLYVLFFQGVVVTVEWVAGGVEAAAYSAAFLVVSALFLVPSLLYGKLLAARLYRWAQHDPETFAAAFHVGVVVMLAVGLALMMATLAAAPALIPLLFGERYRAAVPVLLVLALALPLRCVQSVYSSVFTSPAETARKAWYLGAAAVTSVVGSILLLPPFGVKGAAAAALLAEGVLLVAHVVGTARHIPGITVSQTFRPAVLKAAVGHLLRPGAAL